MSKTQSSGATLELILQAAGTDAAHIRSRSSGQGAQLEIVPPPAKPGVPLTGRGKEAAIAAAGIPETVPAVRWMGRQREAAGALFFSPPFPLRQRFYRRGGAWNC